MTVAISFLNDITNKPEIYISQPDMDKYTLAISTDNTAAVTVTDIRIQFPTSIFDVSDVRGFTPASGAWQYSAAGPYLILTGKSDLSESSPIVLKISGIKTSRSSVTNDDLTVHVASEVPQTKIFLMKYNPGAKNLSDVVKEPQLIPQNTVYRTSGGKAKIENILNLLLTNKDMKNPLVTEPWAGKTPTVLVSFIYGNDIGSLTPADSKAVDPFSAWNINISVSATYKDGKRTFEWTATPPDPGSGEANPIWTLQPAAENTEVLGPRSGANVSFKISGISTDAPAGFTQMYLQYSDFPGYNDGYFAVSIIKSEPAASILYFDADPNYLEALNDTVTLKWQTFAVDKVQLRYDRKVLSSAKGEIDIGADSAALTTVCNINKNTTFTLEAFDKIDDPNPKHSLQQDVFVPPVQIGSFTVAADKAIVGQPAIFKWSVSSALSAELQSSSGPTFIIPAPQIKEGSHTVYPPQPTTYTLVAAGQDGPARESIELFFLTRGWTKKDVPISFDAPGGPRLFAFNNALWLLSGNTNNAVFKSVDGSVWSQEGIAPFSRRNWAAGTLFNNKLWILGGVMAVENTRLNDVWSSDNGTDWQQVSAGASWPSRSNFGCISFNNKLWIIGGTDINLNRLNDIWSSEDGTRWTKVADHCGWSPRSDFALAVFNGRIWMAGGKDSSGRSSDEIWTSGDGSAWTKQAPCPYSCENPIFVANNNCLYLFGGTDEYVPALTEFYVYSDGQWYLVGGPDWNVRNAGYVMFKNALWVVGGSAASSNNNSVWTYFSDVF